MFICLSWWSLRTAGERSNIVEHTESLDREQVLLRQTFKIKRTARLSSRRLRDVPADAVEVRFIARRSVRERLRSSGGLIPSLPASVTEGQGLRYSSPHSPLPWIDSTLIIAIESAQRVWGVDLASGACTKPGRLSCLHGASRLNLRKSAGVIHPSSSNKGPKSISPSKSRAVPPLSIHSMIRRPIGSRSGTRNFLSWSWKKPVSIAEPTS